MPGPRILFITPAASRSGAPMLMLHLIRWLKQHADYELSVVLGSVGPMTAEFAAELPTQTFDQSSSKPSNLQRLLRKIPPLQRRRTAAAAKRCRSVVKNWPPDLVFCNSVGATGVLDAMGPFKCPVIVSVHEMEYVLRSISWVPGGAINAMHRNATHYIAGSNAVRTTLMKKHAVADDMITVVHDCIPTDQFPQLRIREMPAGAASLRESFGVPANAAVVGCVATVEWRKGADLLVPLAREIFRRASKIPIHLIWVGGGDPTEVSQLKFDLAAAGLDDRVHLAGPTARTADWYPMFTAFALLSREDPFPLVALEAAATGLPVVCFADGGGMPEFVEQDCGFVVTYLDLGGFAEAIAAVVEDPALRQQLGNNAAIKVRTRHDVSVAAPLVQQCIARQLAKQA